MRTSAYPCNIAGRSNIGSSSRISVRWPESRKTSGFRKNRVRPFIKVNGSTISKLSHGARFPRSRLSRARPEKRGPSRHREHDGGKTRDASLTRRAWRSLVSVPCSFFSALLPHVYTSVQFSSFSMGALDARSINPSRRENISARLSVSARKRNVSFPSFLEPSR